jgi:hypothetical protein
MCRVWPTGRYRPDSGPLSKLWDCQREPLRVSGAQHVCRTNTHHAIRRSETIRICVRFGHSRIAEWDSWITLRTQVRAEIDSMPGESRSETTSVGNGGGSIVERAPAAPIVDFLGSNRKTVAPFTIIVQRSFVRFLNDYGLWRFCPVVRYIYNASVAPIIGPLKREVQLRMTEKFRQV